MLQFLTSQFAQMRCMTSDLCASDTIGSMAAGAMLWVATCSSSSAPRVTAKMGMADESAGELDPAGWGTGWACRAVGLWGGGGPGAVGFCDGGGGSGAE